MLQGGQYHAAAAGPGWILDLYDSVDDIRASRQTIIYAVHDRIGHLGIFVSGGVAKKEHYEFASNIDFIDCMPPGLYEAVVMHPLRVGYELFSDRNPMMQSVSSTANWVKENRQPVSDDNPLWQWQNLFSDWMIKSLDIYRHCRRTIARRSGKKVGGDEKNVFNKEKDCSKEKAGKIIDWQLQRPNLRSIELKFCDCTIHNCQLLK